MAYKKKICKKCGIIFSPTNGRQIQCKNCADIVKPTKKCKTCGNYFKPIRSTKCFCSDKCAKEFKYYIQNSTLNFPTESESYRSSAPTKEYIKEVNYLLMDFGIDIEIPNFNTVKELNYWKHKIINLHLQ